MIKSFVKFENAPKDDISIRFLHISQINKLLTPQKSSNKPLPRASSTNSARRPSLNNCDLALSAKDYIKEARKIKEKQLKEIEKLSEKDYKCFQSKFLLIDKKKSFAVRKSRVSQMLISPKRLEALKLMAENYSEKSLNTLEEKTLDSVILLENSSEQCEVVWNFVNGNQPESDENKEIHREWVQGLTKEERGYKLYHGTIRIYGWHPKLFSLQKLENVN